MIVYERHPAVENTMNFVVNFATNFVLKTEQTDLDEGDLVEDLEGMHPFLAQLIQFLLQVESFFLTKVFDLYL